VVLTGNVGPNAYSTLQAAGIKIITAVSGTVREVVEAYKSGKLAPPTSGPTVESHFGTGGTTQFPGQGMGRGMGMQNSGFSPPFSSSPPSPLSKDQELEALKEQSKALKSQLDAIMERIERLEKE